MNNTNLSEIILSIKSLSIQASQVNHRLKYEDMDSIEANELLTYIEDLREHVSRLHNRSLIKKGMAMHQDPLPLFKSKDHFAC